MARKPTPAGAPPADTTPPAAETETAAPAQATNPTPAPVGDDAAANGAPEPSAPAPAPDAAPAADDSALAGDDRDALELGDARVLIAFGEHVPDDIVSGTLVELGVLERDGKVDTHPDAVAYVRSLSA